MPREHLTEAAEKTIVSIADKTMGGGAIAGIVGFLSEINWIGLIGALVAIGGLVVSVYFQHRRDRRESEMHRARLSALRNGSKHEP